MTVIIASMTLEFITDEECKPIEFNDKGQADEFLRDFGFREEEVEDQYFFIELKHRGEHAV